MDPLENKIENIHDVLPGSGSPAGLKAPAAEKILSAPPGLEQIFDVPKSDIPQGVSSPPCFDATFIELVTSKEANDEVPPPPTWLADVPTESLMSPATSITNLTPRWWPASPTGVVLMDATPPPPTWNPGEAKEAEDDQGINAESETNQPLSPSRPPPPPPMDAQVLHSTPPPPSYDAPGFESVSTPLSLPPNIAAPPTEPPKLDVPFEDLSENKAPPSAPPKDLLKFGISFHDPIDTNASANVAAPPTEPPKLLVQVEDLCDVKAPPSSPPKELPKIKVSLNDLTDAKVALGNAPSMAPATYMAPGFALPSFNGMMSPSYMHPSGCTTPYSPMDRTYPSPAGVPPSWGRF